MMDVFTDLVTCSICWSRMEDPRCLPCLHAFCYECIAGLRECGLSPTAIHCPSCSVRHENVIIEQLPQDFKIVQIIDRMEQKDLLDSSTCFEHKKQLELFCYSSTCLLPICYKCSITSHQNHDIAEMREYYQALMGQVTEAEKSMNVTINNMGMYHDRRLKLQSTGNKLKMMVDHKVNDLVMQEKMRFRSEFSEDSELIQLNHLQLQLMDLKQRLTCNSFATWSNGREMKDVHQLVTRLTRDLNHTCDSAVSSIKGKQVSAQDLAVFTTVVHGLLRDRMQKPLAVPAPDSCLSVERSRESLNSASPGATADDSRSSSTDTSSSKSSPVKFSHQAPQVIIRFQVVNPSFDKYVEIRDCCLLGEDFVVIDKRNEWIKSFDVGIGRYIGANKKGMVCMPIGVHTINNNTMLLVEESVGQTLELFFVNKALTEKEPFEPEIPEDIHEVATSPTGQIYICTKSMAVYEQQQVAPGHFRDTCFQRLFQTNITVSAMAASGTGTVALGCARDHVIYAYDRTGQLKWRFPAESATAFKRLKQLNYNLTGNLVAVDNYFQQVHIIAPDGSVRRILHGRGLQFARPICVTPRGDNQVIIMSEVGSVVVIESYM